MRKQYDDQHIDSMLRELGQIKAPRADMSELTVRMAAGQAVSVTKSPRPAGRRFNWQHAVVVAAALIFAVIVVVEPLLKKGGYISQPETALISQNNIYGNWEYAEYDSYVILTGYLPEMIGSTGIGAAGTQTTTQAAISHCAAALASRADPQPRDSFTGYMSADHEITIPDTIKNKPVVEISEDCITKFLQLYGGSWEQVSWNVSEYNEYFTYEEFQEQSNTGYSFHSCALYNKDKTTLYWSYFNASDVMSGENSFTVPKSVKKIYNGALCFTNGNPLVFEYDDVYFTVLNNMLFDKNLSRLIRVVDTHAEIMYYDVPISVMTIDPGAFMGVVNYNSLDGEYMSNPSNQSRGFGFSDIVVSLPDSIEEIPDYMFQGGYAGLQKTPEKLQRIGVRAFDSAFYAKMDKTLYITKGVSEIGVPAFPADGVRLEIAQDNQYFIIEDGALLTIDKNVLILFFGGHSFYGMVRYEVPDTVVHICYEAFVIGDLDSLNELYVPSTVNQIDDFAICIYRWERPFTIFGQEGSCIDQYVTDYLAFYNSINWYPLLRFQPVF